MQTKPFCSDIPSGPVAKFLLTLDGPEDEQPVITKLLVLAVKSCDRPWSETFNADAAIAWISKKPDVGIMIVQMAMGSNSQLDIYRDREQRYELRVSGDVLRNMPAILDDLKQVVNTTTATA